MPVYEQEKAIILAGKWEQVSHPARKGEEVYVPPLTYTI